MKRLLLIANLAAALILIALGVEHFVAPRIAVAIYADTYKDEMFKCDQAMREHFIAKQMVNLEVNEGTVRNLEAAEIGLTSCHRYDLRRKQMIRWGVSENMLSSIGLEAIEDRATDIRKFVEIHEIRY